MSPPGSPRWITVFCRTVRSVSWHIAAHLELPRWRYANPAGSMPAAEQNRVITSRAVSGSSISASIAIRPSCPVLTQNPASGSRLHASSCRISVSGAVVQPGIPTSWPAAFLTDGNFPAALMLDFGESGVSGLHSTGNTHGASSGMEKTRAHSAGSAPQLEEMSVMMPPPRFRGYRPCGKAHI